MERQPFELDEFDASVRDLIQRCQQTRMWSQRLKWECAALREALADARARRSLVAT